MAHQTDFLLGGVVGALDGWFCIPLYAQCMAVSMQILVRWLGIPDGPLNKRMGRINLITALSTLLACLLVSGFLLAGLVFRPFVLEWRSFIQVWRFAFLAAIVVYAVTQNR